MTSKKRQNSGRGNEKLWGRGWLSCFGRSVKYGGTAYTFREEEIAELREPPKNIARIQLGGRHGCYLEKTKYLQFSLIVNI